MLLSCDFYISIYVFLLSNSHILPLIFLLCDAIATFAHRDSAAYPVAVEVLPILELLIDVTISLASSRLAKKMHNA